MIALAALGVRVWLAVDQPLWGDEVAAARAITAGGAGDVLTWVSHRKAEPPGWYLLVWGLTEVTHAVGASVSVAAWRAVSVIAGTLTCILVMLEVRLVLSDRFAALAAGVLVAAGSLGVLYGAQLRSYALMGLLSVAYIGLLHRTAAAPTVRRAAAVVAVGTLGFLTHYFFALTIAAGLAWILTTRGLRIRRRTRWALATLNAAALAPGAAWLVHASDRSHHARYVGGFSAHRIVAIDYSIFFQYLHAGRFAPLAQLALFAAAVYGAVRLWPDPIGRLLALAWIIPVVAAAAAWEARVRIFTTRNFIGVAPFVAIGLVAAVGNLPRRAAWIGYAALAVGVTASLGLTQLPLGRTPYDQAARFILGSGGSTKTPILLFGNPPWGMKVITWYFPGHQELRPTHTAQPGCHAIYAVSYDAAGAAWLHEHSHEVQEEVTLPFFGADTPEGTRSSARLIVARIKAPAAYAASRSAQGIGARLYVPLANPPARRGIPCK